MKNILVVIGHPITGSFAHAVASTYATTAREHGAEVRVVDLASSEVAGIDVTRAELKVAGIEDTLRLGSEINYMAESVAWANHLVFAYPVWWGTYPAVLKAFFDRVFLAGFVFAHKSGPQWHKYLKGKTARVFVSMDAPAWFDKIWYRNASVSSLTRAILWYTGVATVGVTKFERMRFSSEVRRKKWLNKVALSARRDSL